MEYNLVIYCVECTDTARIGMKMYSIDWRYALQTFSSLTEATHHITQYGHEVKIELDPQHQEDD